MKYLDLTLATPQENLACDEALLDACEQGHDGEILRFWESSAPFVVLGYSNKTATEVNLDSARRARVPVLRRCTGGGAVLQGAGCLNYSLILKIPESGPLAGISSTNAHIMNRHRDALAKLLGGDIVVQGHSDLARDVMKFSGNAQRRRGRSLLFHGTFLLETDIELVERLLPMPSRRPAYRHDRSHRDFLTNLEFAAHNIKEALKSTWQASEPLRNIPAEKTASLAKNRYSTDEWNFKF
jgi:lipoate-protein ligase A